MTRFITKRWGFGVFLIALIISTLLWWLYIFGVLEKINFLQSASEVSSKEKVVEQYINGLISNDAVIIRGLISPTYDAVDVIKKKLEQFKGANFNGINITYNEDFSLVKVEIGGIKTRDGKMITEQIHIEKDCAQIPGIKKCEKWYLIMGNLKEKYKPVFPLE